MTRAPSMSLLDQIRAAAELLEALAADRSLLGDIPVEERKRLLRAMTLVRNPSSRTRRRQEKAAARAERAARVQRDQSALNETGIRTLRRKPVYTTPNFFLPQFAGGKFEPHDVHDESEAVASTDPRSCYIC